MAASRFPIHGQTHQGSHSAEQMKAAFTELMDQSDPRLGVDNNWMSVYPYQVEAKPGPTVPLEVRYRNWLYADSMLRGVFRAPEGFTFEPQTAEVHAPAKSSGATRSTMR